MSVGIGIIGLPKSGRTTVFNALTGSRADTQGYNQVKVPNIGIAKVPDKRLRELDTIFHARKIIPAEVKYVDIGASLKEIVADKGLSGPVLAELSKVDALIIVVRAFQDESMPHASGSIDIARDIADMDMELAFSDLALLEKRLERIDISLKSAKAGERPPILREKELLGKIKADLEKDIPFRDQKLSEDEIRALSGYQFLTEKPLLVVINIGEEQLSGAEAMGKEYGECLSGPKRRVVALAGKLEMELAQLDEKGAAELREAYDLKESGLERAIRLSFDLLGMISFFTVGPDEVRAWPIRRGTPAVKAAGKIHSDLERGFIRAEVISNTDLLACHGYTEAKKKGLVRLEGKNYIVQDGDVIEVLFNV